MSATVDKSKAVLGESQRKWVWNMAALLGLDLKPSPQDDMLITSGGAVQQIVGREPSRPSLESGEGPPKPQSDAKPRQIVFVITDETTKDAVKNAIVTLDNHSATTGERGEASISISPGNYSFRVTADEFDPFVSTYEVSADAATDDWEQSGDDVAARQLNALPTKTAKPGKTQAPAKNDKKAGPKRVELKPKTATPASETVLTVSPRREALVSQKLVLTATVKMRDGTAVPPGVVVFEATLTKSPRKVLKKVDVKDGKAVHIDDSLAKGQYVLDATYSPNPPIKDNPGSQAKSVSQSVVADFKPTTNIDKTGQQKRRDELPITRAKTEAEVTKIVEDQKTGHKGLSAAKLDQFNTLLQGAKKAPPVPTGAETKQIREKYAKLNDALLNGNAVDAARLSRELGLPVSEQDVKNNPSKLTDVQWKTLLALGVADITVTKDNTGVSWNGPGVPVIPSRELNALNGNAGYSQLIDDMAAHGVNPLSAPPDQDQIRTYMEHLQGQAERQAKSKNPKDPDAQKRAVADALLQASQRLMDGMQVHYRGASGNDPTYGENQKLTAYLVRKGELVLGTDGKPVREKVDPKDPKLKAKLDAFEKRNGGGKAKVSHVQSPEGMDDNTSRPVYGNRHESDCEGMASFRLRTLPPDFKSIGVVSGRLRAKPTTGHMIAVFQSPDGRVFLSSNGKPLNQVAASGKAATASDIHTAVVKEFLAIYKTATKEDEFLFGIGKTMPPSDTSLEEANKSTDRVLQDAADDDSMRTNQLMPKKAKLDWNQLAP